MLAGSGLEAAVLHPAAAGSQVAPVGAAGRATRTGAPVVRQAAAWGAGDPDFPAPPFVFAEAAAALSTVTFGAELPDLNDDVALTLDGVRFGTLRWTGGNRYEYVPLEAPAFASGARVTVTGAETTTSFSGDLLLPSPVRFTHVPSGLILTVTAPAPGAPNEPPLATTTKALRWQPDDEDGYVELLLLTRFKPDARAQDSRTFCRVRASEGEIVFETNPTGPFVHAWTATVTRVSARSATPASTGITLFSRRPLANLARVDTPTQIQGAGF